METENIMFIAISVQLFIVLGFLCFAVIAIQDDEPRVAAWLVGIAAIFATFACAIACVGASL